MDEELESYEVIGKLKYETADMDVARHFHDKAMHVGVEPKDSITRTIAKKQIDFYLKDQCQILQHEEVDVVMLLPIVRPQVREKLVKIVQGGRDKKNLRKMMEAVNENKPEPYKKMIDGEEKSDFF